MLLIDVIPIGTLVSVRLQVDATARGPAALVVAWSGGGHTGGHDECIAAPGGFCTASVTPGMKGLLRIAVDMNAEADRGDLTVHPVTASAPIQGDQSWLYVVE
jgi:hypothetical protein